MLGVLLQARLLDAQLFDLAAHGVAVLAVAGDVLFQQADLLAVQVEPLLLFEHAFLGRGPMLQGGLQLVLRALQRADQVAAAARELVRLLAPGRDLAHAALHLGAQAAHLTVVGFEALVEQLEAAAAAGAGGAQPLAVSLGGFQLALGALDVRGEVAGCLLGGGQLFLEVLALRDEALDVAGDVQLLGGERVAFRRETAMAGGGVLHAGLAHGQLLAELGHFALQPVGLAGERGALGHQAVEQGGGVEELVFEVRNLPA